MSIKAAQLTDQRIQTGRRGRLTPHGNGNQMKTARRGEQFRRQVKLAVEVNLWCCGTNDVSTLTFRIKTDENDWGLRLGNQRPCNPFGDQARRKLFRKEAEGYDLTRKGPLTGGCRTL